MEKNKVSKTRIFLVIYAILQILMSINLLLNADMVLKDTIDTIQNTGIMQKDMIDKVADTGMASLYITSTITILLSGLIIYYSVKNKTARRKGFLIAVSVYGMIFSNSFMLMILSLISLIVCIKINKEKGEKKPIPVIERKKPTTEQIISAILLLGIYFSQLIWSKYLPEDLSQTTTLIITAVFDLIITSLAIWVFRKELKEEFKLFKSNFKTYILYILPRLGIMYLIYIIVDIAIVMSGYELVSQNQKILEQLPLVFIIPFAIIIAPINEELLFRGCIRRFIGNGTLFIIVSAIVFGVLHTIIEDSMSDIIIKSIPYAILGGYLAYIYKKTNNLCTNICSHSFFNLIGVTVLVASRLL